jgi:putative ATP-binding cassette transporter
MLLKANSLQPGMGGDKSDAWYMQIDFLSKCLVVELVLVIIFAVFFEYYLLMSSDRTSAGPEPTADAQSQQTDFFRLFTGMRELMTPYFCSPHGVKGRAYCVITLSLGVAALFLAFVHNTWQLEFWNLFQKPEKDGLGKFFDLMSTFVVLVIAFVVVDVYSQYVRALLYIDWRGFMTEQFVQRYLEHRAYYGISINQAVDNPDQRIQEDLSMFVLSAITITWEFFSSIGHLLLFIPLLLLYSPSKAFGVVYLPGWLLYLTFIYSMIGTAITHFVGKRLIAIGFAKQKTEADFRFGLVEVRDHAEAIAVSGSERTIEGRLSARFNNFRSAWWWYMQANKRLTTFTRSFNLVKVLLPFFILAPSFFAGDIPLGRLFQLVHALAEVGQAFDFLISSYSQLAEWRATTDRLTMFNNAMYTHKVPPRPYEESDTIVVKDMALRLPTGRHLWTLPELHIPDGWVLLTGTEGVGKTTFLRALSGVWPYFDGEVKKPGTGVVFVPQEPFFPPLSLAAALSFPLEAVEEKRAAAEIEAVGLGELLDGHEEGVLREADWMKCLSMGQRQRLVLGSLLVRDPPPRMVFIDESLSHQSEAGAMELLRLLRRRLPGTNVIHVSHDVATLGPLHDTVLRASVDAKGTLCFADLKQAEGTGSTR